MSDKPEKPLRRKTVTAAGAVCLPIAAMFIAFAVVLIISLVPILNAPEIDYGEYFLVFLFDKFFTAGLTFAFTVLVVFFFILTVLYILMSVAMLRQGNKTIVTMALVASIVISSIICLVALYPFITGIGRIIVHGPSGHVVRFLILGLLPFSLSTAIIALGALSLKKPKKLQD